MPRRGWLADRLRRAVDTVRRDARESAAWTFRLTAAAVASYVVALALLATPRPLLAPLTALLVIHATPVSLLTSGLDRVVSVVAGVLLAVGVAVVFPLTWWSLALVIGLSLLVGQALRLRDNLMEVPISAMLVLGVADAEGAALGRVAETLVGAGVGVLANLAFPRKVTYASAAQALDDLAGEISAMLRRGADWVAESGGDGDRVAEAAERCLDEARRISRDIPHVSRTIEQVEEGRRLNVRMVRAPDAAPGLRQGLEALEHCVLSLRSMFRSVRDASQDDTWPRDDSAPHAAGDVVDVLTALSDAVAAFGQLVRTEATAGDLRAPERASAVEHALEGMRSAITMLFDRGADQNAALAELYVSLGSAVKRVRRELDLHDRARRQDVLRPVRRPVREVLGPRLARRRPPG